MVLYNLQLRAGDMRRAGLNRVGLWPRRNVDIIKLQLNPLIEYACSVWRLPPRQLNKLTSAWNYTLRAAVGVPKYVSVVPLQGDLDMVYTPRFRRLFYLMCMYHRIATMGSHRIVRRMVEQWDRQQMLNRTTSFWTRCRKAAEELDISHMLSPSVVHGHTRVEWKIKMKEVALEAATKAWKKALEEHASLDTYKAIKSEPEFEGYLRRGGKSLQQFVATLRADSLPVQACKKSARYYRTGGLCATDRCYMCAEDVPETTAHFLLECKAYDRSASPLGKLWPKTMEGCS